MEKNENLISKIKTLMVSYGFIEEKPAEVEYQSFKVGEAEQIFQSVSLEVENEIFTINEASGEREAAVDGTYQIEDFDVEVKEGKIESVTSKFADVVLADGNVLAVNGELVVGVEVMVVSEDGNVPAPDGEYILEDGKTIVIVEGLVSEIKEVEGEPTPEPDPEPEVVEAEQMSQETLNEVLDLFVSFVESVNSKMTSVEESVNTLKNEFETFGKEPATKPIKKTKVELNNQTSDLITRIRELNKTK